MKKLVIIGLLLFSSSAAAQFIFNLSAPLVGSSEEFVGPFASWACVRTAASGTCGAATSSFCNAAATGGDDTSAIQACFNLLAAGTAKNIWLPTGTYHISSTITLHTLQMGMGIVCADPTATTIQWIGAAGGTMFLFNGVAYSRFDRCTFDASTVNSAATIIDQTWDNNGGTGNSDNHNQYADDVFKNATGAGFKCGDRASGQCSEISMLRDKFINNGNGITLCEFNALDVWVWYSQFTNNINGVNNGDGATNGCGGEGAGNFHVFQSVFQGSTNTDIEYGNAGIFNIRNNYSNNSNQFIHSGGGNGPDLSLIQGNIIINPVQQLAVKQQDWGPSVFIDNTIKSTGNGTPVVQMGNSTGDMFSFGNTFTAGTISNTCVGSSPVQMANTPGPSRCHSVTDTVSTVTDPGAPVLPGVPPNRGRQIYEPGAFTGAAIQIAINNAVAGTSKAVVHIPTGVYNISTTLTIPANSDIQLIGDGYTDQGSILNWTGGATGPALKLSSLGAGPSRATLREFGVKGNAGAADCIEIDNADQPDAKIYGEGINQGGGGTTIGYFADGLTNTLTELHDHAATVASNTAIAASGTTNIFLGSTFSNAVNVSASTGTLNLIGFWTESPGSGVFTAGQANNSAIVSYAGSQWGFPGANPSIFSFTNFVNRGSVLVVDVAQNSGGTLDIGNSAGSTVLGLGINGATSSYWNNAGSPAGTTEFLNSGYTTGLGTTQLTESSLDPTFVGLALKLLRTQQPTLPVDRPKKATDVKMFRVAVSFCRYGIHVVP